jgi:pullulanase-type alpha-1,6-glucosidase
MSITTPISRWRRLLTGAAAFALVASSGLGIAASQADQPGDSPIAPATSTAVESTTTLAEPVTITAPGTFNDELGCDGDWVVACAAVELTYDQASGKYWSQFDIPAGDYQFKIAENLAWDVSYGVDGSSSGDNNMSFTATAAPTYIIYDPLTHLSVATSAAAMVTVPGSFNAQLGCSGDWTPDCLAIAMYPLSNGTFSYSTSALKAGNYEVKVAIGRSWAENYGPGGVPNSSGNIPFATADGALVDFVYNPTNHLLTVTSSEKPAFGTGASVAIWRDQTTLAVPASLDGLDAASLTYAWPAFPEFKFAPAGPIDSPTVGIPATEIASYLALTVSRDCGDTACAGSDADALKSALRQGPYDLVGVDQAGERRLATGMQTALLIDDLYPDAADATLGLTWADGAPTACVWAPTASSVSLIHADAALAAAQESVDTSIGSSAAATLDPTSGSWCVTGSADWANQAYRWDVEVFVPSEGKIIHNSVTDPYSVGLTIDSRWSVFVDLDSPQWMPSAWSDTPNPEPLRSQTQQTIYELQVRDFSAADSSVDEAIRGTYAAFTDPDSAGMTHLKELAEAGLTTVHLLPTFDIATIEEDRAKRVEPTIPQAAADSSAQADAVKATIDQDAYNWGYDPWHYNTPEGSYASDGNQNGGARVAQFRAMVAALHQLGLRVVLDVVYNHTNAAGQAEKSVLDKVVPGYYHRENSLGQVRADSCCSDTASEHAMFSKLMVDSVLMWASDYRVDGFRFDIMGLHDRQTMLDIRQALDGLTLADDGIDGSAVYLYGEAWNTGASTNDAIFTAARQANLAGSGIGSFNDRMRDAVRGGGPFDGDQRDYQGFGTGLYTDPNEYPDLATFAGTDVAYDAKDNLYYVEDLIRLGLAGNLASYELPSNQGDGQAILGADYGYGNANGSAAVDGRQAAGFAAEPQEVINYADCHDGTILFDNGVWKLPTDATMDTRSRMQVLSLATALLSQSPAFFTAGDEILRSKSLDSNTYNSGDHFNAIDWSMESNVFGSGLPVTGINTQAAAPLLADSAIKPDQDAMEQTNGMTLDLLRLRSSLPLLTLGSADLINQRVSFLNDGVDPTPGLIIMDIEDPATGSQDIDPTADANLVVFNASPETITEVIDGQSGRDWRLNAIQAGGADDVVKGLTFDATSGTLTIPGRTAAVLVLAADPSQPGEEPSPTTPPNGGASDSPAKDGAAAATGGVSINAGGVGVLIGAAAILLMMVGAFHIGLFSYRRRKG